ncbi:dihydrofolate reductase [Candidatus Peregrinibacteria bacterium]|nr:dihydrofolate reductase [Candidatus Peregrinibacteria bacterium]
MIVSIIAAVSENNVIGRKGRLPWSLPADMKRMKNLTMGHPLIMGRKTHESIGRALPGRRNIVVTRRKTAYPGCEVAASITEALAAAENDPSGEAFVFGGEEIYRQAIGVADRIHLTRVRAAVEGDAYFPVIDANQWKEISREDHPADAENEYPFSFITYERRR